MSIKLHDAARCVIGFCLIYRIIGEHILPQIPVVADYNFTAVLSIPGHARFRMHTCSFVMTEVRLCLCFVLLALHNLQSTIKKKKKCRQADEPLSCAGFCSHLHHDILTHTLRVCEVVRCLQDRCWCCQVGCACWKKVGMW